MLPIKMMPISLLGFDSQKIIEVSIRLAPTDGMTQKLVAFHIDMKANAKAKAIFNLISNT